MKFLLVVHRNSPNYGGSYSEVDEIVEADTEEEGRRFIAVIHGHGVHVAVPPVVRPTKGTFKQQRQAHTNQVHQWIMKASMARKART